MHETMYAKYTDSVRLNSFPLRSWQKHWSLLTSLSIRGSGKYNKARKRNDGCTEKCGQIPNTLCLVKEIAHRAIYCVTGYDIL
jgi:hypothetical protein